jgi:hypothetical protein
MAIDMNKLGQREGMLTRAASRVRTAHLERQRATKAFNQRLKDANVSALAGDALFEQLRADMQTAKENFSQASIVYEALKVCPPLT